MSTLAFAAHEGRADGVRPHPKKARPKESRPRKVRPAERWPAWTDEIRVGVPHPDDWPAWTSEVRVAISKKGR